MSSYCQPCRRGLSPFCIAFILVIACAILGLLAFTPADVDTSTISHALEKHPSSAEAARQIIATCNPDARLEYTSDGKILWCVKLPDGRTAIQVCNGAGCEITAFISRSKHYLGNFLARGNYEPVH